MKSRDILIADKGNVYTNGIDYGTTIILAEGVDSSIYYQVPESEISNFEEAEFEDYQEALVKLGVSRNE